MKLHKGKYLRTDKIREKNRLASIGKKASLKTRLKMRETRLQLNLIGKKHPCWKGGRVKISSYMGLSIPNHPFCNKQGYIMEHRYMAECCIERFLEPSEEIHHINGNKTNNRPENLYLFNNHSHHGKYHEDFKKKLIPKIIKSNLL